MAACLNHIATLLFLFAVVLTPPHLHVCARESKFFSKVTNHISKSSKTSVPEVEPPLGVPVAAPELSPAPALSPVPAAEESGYDNGSNGVPSAPEKNLADGTTVDEFEGKISGEEVVGETFNTGYSDAFSNNFKYDDNVNARSVGGFSSGDVNPTESQQGLSDTRYLENGKYFYGPEGKNSHGNAYEQEEGAASSDTYNLKGNVYPTTSQQGMSDTRYLENGKYFYDPKGKNSYGNAYEEDRQTASDNTYNLKGDVYQTKSQQEMSDTKYLDNGKHFDDPKNKNSYGNAYEPEEETATANTYNLEGMSNTRYLENGKYFYNLKGENSHGNSNEQEQRTATAAGNSYNAKENNSDAYEFGTMEEYYRKQGIVDPQDQGVYVP